MQSGCFGQTVSVCPCNKAVAVRTCTDVPKLGLNCVTTCWLNITFTHQAKVPLTRLQPLTWKMKYLNSLSLEGFCFLIHNYEDVSCHKGDGGVHHLMLDLMLFIVSSPTTSQIRLPDSLPLAFGK